MSILSSSSFDTKSLLLLERIALLARTIDELETRTDQELSDEEDSELSEWEVGDYIVGWKEPGPSERKPSDEDIVGPEDDSKLSGTDKAPRSQPVSRTRDSKGPKARCRPVRNEDMYLTDEEDGKHSIAPTSKAEESLSNDANMEALKNFEQKVNATKFRSDLVVRMGIIGLGAKETRSIKGGRRAWVLQACIAQGMDLKKPFSDWPFESQMYPAIKLITETVPKEWGWDRVVTRDVIRTLC